MIARQKGSIINLGSMLGLIVHRPHTAASYVASKGAVHMLTKAFHGVGEERRARERTGASDVTRSPRAQVEDRGGNLGRFADAAHRGHIQPDIEQLRALTHLQGHVRGHRSRRHSINRRRLYRLVRPDDRSDAPLTSPTWSAVRW